MPAPRRYGVVGDVRSPAPRLLESLGFELCSLDLGTALSQLREGSLAGAAIGLPDAVLAPRLVTGSTLSGSIDTLSSQAGAPIGRDAFSAGFAAALARQSWGIPERPALILGAGARARSVGATLLENGTRHLRIAARSMARALPLIEFLQPAAKREGALLDLVPLDAVRFEEGWERAVVVNATPVGLDSPRADPLSRFARLGGGMRVVDLVDRPIRTSLLRRAHRSKGAYLLGMAVWTEEALCRAEWALGRPVEPTLAEQLRSAP